MPKSLRELLEVEYPLRLIPDPDGGYVFEYPDLPGCLGQIDALDALPAHAEEARHLWIETAHELGKDIPSPTHQDDYSGKFIVRIPRTLHRKLAETARAEGVSLNAYVISLLAAGHVASELSGNLDELSARVTALDDRLSALPDETQRRAS